jgi:hypothetical protein
MNSAPWLNLGSKLGLRSSSCSWIDFKTCSAKIGWIVCCVNIKRWSVAPMRIIPTSSLSSWLIFFFREEFLIANLHNRSSVAISNGNTILPDNDELTASRNWSKAVENKWCNNRPKPTPISTWLLGFRSSKDTLWSMASPCSWCDNLVVFAAKRFLQTRVWCNSMDESHFRLAISETKALILSTSRRISVVSVQTENFPHSWHEASMIPLVFSYFIFVCLQTVMSLSFQEVVCWN